MNRAAFGQTHRVFPRRSRISVGELAARQFTGEVLGTDEVGSRSDAIAVCGPRIRISPLRRLC